MRSDLTDICIVQGKSIIQSPAVQTDSNNSNDEDNLRNFSSTHRRILRNRSSSTSTTSQSAAFAFRLRRNNSIVPTELLAAEEAGLSSVRVRLSSAEMQRRYHSAFSQGKRTEEVEEMQKEHQEVDLGPERKEAEIVRKTGRRASISEQPVSPVMMGARKREIHTSAKVEEQRIPSSPAPEADSVSPSIDATATPFTDAPPPMASNSKNRRNSTSASFPVPLDKSTFSAPKVTRVRERRPPASGVQAGERRPQNQVKRYSPGQDLNQDQRVRSKFNSLCSAEEGKLTK